MQAVALKMEGLHLQGYICEHYSLTERDLVVAGVQVGATGEFSGLDDRLWEEESFLKVKSEVLQSL